MTSLEIELAVTEHIGIRQNMIVPNVYWGMGFRHELDLMVLMKSGYANEIEIKTSKSDLKRDKEKDKWKRHEYSKYTDFYESSKLIRCLYFAIPQELENCIQEIPERAGIYMVWKDDRWNEYHCRVFRRAKINKNALKLTEKQQMMLGRLASMRIWGLKRKLLEIK